MNQVCTSLRIRIGAYHVKIQNVGTIVISPDINDFGGEYVQELGKLDNGTPIDVLVHEIIMNSDIQVEEIEVQQCPCNTKICC